LNHSLKSITSNINTFMQNCVNLFTIILMNFTELTVVGIISIMDKAIRRIIETSKRVNAFRTLCQQDQIALLKGEQ
jgi:hypothetical protein